MAKFKVVHTQRDVLLDYVQREYDKLLEKLYPGSISEIESARMRRLRNLVVACCYEIISSMQAIKNTTSTRNSKLKEKPMTVQLTDQESKLIARAVLNTWGAIGGDCEQCAGGKALSLAAMVEVVLDANHLENFGVTNNTYSRTQPAILEAVKKFRNMSYPQQKKIARTALKGN